MVGVRWAMAKIKSDTGSAIINGQIVDGALIGGVFHYENANGEFVAVPRPRSFSSNDQYSDACMDMGEAVVLGALPALDRYDCRAEREAA